MAGLGSQQYFEHSRSDSPDTHQRFSESSPYARSNNKIRMKRICREVGENPARYVDRIQIFSNDSYIIGDPDPSAYHRCKKANLSSYLYPDYF